jgi:hypothetical protein
MSEREPEGPYVYQPFGSATHKAHDAADRLWGVGGIDLLAEVRGLTKLEAQRIVAALSGRVDYGRLQAEVASLRALLARCEPWMKHQSSGAICCADVCFCGLGALLADLRAALGEGGQAATSLLADARLLAEAVLHTDAQYQMIGCPGEDEALVAAAWRIVGGTPTCPKG